MTSPEDSLDSFLFGNPSSPSPLPSFATSLESFQFHPPPTLAPQPPSLYPTSSAPSPSSGTSPVHSPPQQLSPATLESFVISQPPSDATLHLPILTITPVPSPNPSPPQQPTLVPSPTVTSLTPVPSPLPPSPYPSGNSSPNTESPSPSPPDDTIFTPYVPPSSSPTNKKRKQVGSEIKDIGSPGGGEWKEYLLAPNYYQVHDAVTLQPITELLDVTAQQVGSKFSFSQTDNACICYRQNQFKVFSLFRSPQPVESMCVNDGGVPKRITQICAKLYAINQINGALRDELRVGLHIAGKKRRKEAKVEVDITPFEKGKIEFCNLQFEKSNASKQPAEQQEYFHIVLAVFAKCEDSSTYHVLSKISPRIIVRAQNPGFYEETKPPPTPQAQPSCTDTTMFSTNFVANINVNTQTNTFNNNTPLPAAADVNNVNYENPTFQPQHVIENNYVSENNNYEDTAMMTNNEQHITIMEVDQVLEGGTRVKKEEEAWQCAQDAVFHYGKVGINTSDPKEALHVQGNMLVTGTVYKPSDMRIKSQIELVDPKLQLGNIRQLKIYDYVVQSRQERGVLAQELAMVMPDAVHEMGDVELGSTTIPNLLVVNERVLLYENLGATQQLDKELEEEKEVIEKIDEMVSNLAETTNQSTEEAQATLKSMLDMLFKEECRNKISYAGLEEEYVNFSFSLFRMGPARSLFVLGNFSPWAWVLGALYIFSNIKERRWLGLSSLIRYVTFLSLQVLFFYGLVEFNTVWINLVSGMGAGVWTLIVSYIRLRRTLKKESTDKRSHLFKALGFKPPEQKYKYLFF